VGKEIFITIGGLMKSYIKIYGPPVIEGIKALEQIAIDSMPRVCIMNTMLQYGIETALSYGSPLQNLEEEVCDKIISKSGEKLGEYDFFFEWFKDPTSEEINDLIEKIDKAFVGLGCRYTIITK
jgi:hypothetical protein